MATFVRALVVMGMVAAGWGVAGAQPLQTFNPATLSVGSVEVGSTGMATMTIGNSGSVTLTLSMLTIVGANATDFAFTDHGCTGQTCVPVGPSIAPAGSSAYVIRCSPSATGTRTAVLTVASNDPASPRTANLTCTGITPEVTISPLSLSFGSVRVGTPSSLMFTISNSNAANTAPLTFSVSEAIVDMSVTCTPTCSGSLGPGMNATVTVTYQPTATGLRSGNIVVTTNDLDESTVNVAVTGTGVESNLSASTPPPFGNVPVAQTGGSVQNATITNNGGASLNTTAMTITGDASFSFAFPSGLCTSGTSCSRTVTAGAGGGMATIPIRCDPASAGVKTATLNIQSDDPAPAGGTAIALTCTGTASSMMVSPTSLTFANQRINTTSATMAVTVTNTGGAPLNYTVTTPAGGQFITMAGAATCSPTCAGLTVAAGGMATVTVAFRPTSTGLKNGVVLVDDTDNFVSDVNVTVSGAGVEPVAMLSTASSLAFGNVNINTTSGPQTITVMNTGTMDLTISGVSETDSGNDFDLTGPTGLTTVGVGGTQSWMVTCDPESRGAKTGTITINNNSNNATALAVALTCTSLEGLVVVTGSPVAVIGGNLDFGPVIVGAMRTTTVTVTNQGNVAVTISSVGIAPTTEGFTNTAPAPDMVVPAGGSRTFSVTFAPTNPAQGIATLSITSDWNDPNLALLGDALTSGFSCSPSMAMLGDVPWDSTQPQLITLQNTGDASMNVISVAWASGDTGEFAPIAAGTGQGQLAAGQMRTFTITAVPTDAMLGVRNAVLRITTDLQLAPFCDIVVGYTSVGPAVTLSPGMTVDFGGVDIDAGPVIMELQLTNTGTGRMDIVSVSALTGSFTRSSFADLSVDPFQAETLMITFDPAAEGSELAPETQTFTITTDGLYLGTIQQPAAIQITVRGFGIDRHIAAADVVFPPTYRYPGDAQVPTDSCGAGGDEACAIRICNTGAARLDVTMIDDADDAFDLASTAPLMVAGGSMAAPTCADVAVAFRPTGAGPFSSTVTITNNDNGAPMAQVTLTGSGIARDVVVPTTAIDLGRLPLGDHDLSELEVRINNRTGDTFAVRELRPVGTPPRFELRLGSGVALAPGDQAIDGTLHLAAAGQHTEQFDVFLDDDPEPYGRLSITVEGVEKENYYSCASGRPVELGGGLLAAMVAIAMRRRRRYRRPCTPSDGITMNGS